MSSPTPLFTAGSAFPKLTWETVGGERFAVGEPKDRWTLVVVYRGKHCPRCKAYLNTLDAMMSDWEAAGFDILAVSADPIDKARADVEEFGWRFPVAYGMDESEMRSLGLYVSAPLSEKESDRNFAEPGLYCIKPDGSVLLIAVSNGPSARPDLAQLLDGMKFTIANDRPPRGTA